MNKRIIALMLSLILIVTLLAGCKKAEPATQSTTTTTVSQTTVDSQTKNETSGEVTSQTAAETSKTNIDAGTVGQSTATSVKGTTTKATVTEKATIETITTTTTIQTTTTVPKKTYTLTPVPASEYYGYTLLKGMQNSTALLSVYQDIVSGVKDMKTEVKISVPLTVQELLTVFYYYHDDYPQHFWCDSAFEYTTVNNMVTSVTLKYNMTKAQRDAAQPAFEAEVKKCLKEAAFGKDEYEREKLIHDYLAKTVTYQGGTHAHDAYGALVDKKAVCEGYSRAFQWLLYQAGVQSLIVEGSSTNPANGQVVPHAWNMVKIDGKYYHVDVTWDDASAKEVMYAYFNMTAEQISEGHNINHENCYPIPNATDTAANYHVVNGTVLTSYSVDSVASLMQRTTGELHVYIAGKPADFIGWFKTNVKAIAEKIGITGSFSYGTTQLGKEVVLHIIPK